MARGIKVKGFYIVFKYDLKHIENRWRKKSFEIWKEFDENYIWNSPTYEVIGYFESKKDAQQFIKNQ